MKSHKSISKQRVHVKQVLLVTVHGKIYAKRKRKKGLRTADREGKVHQGKSAAWKKNLKRLVYDVKHVLI